MTEKTKNTIAIILITLLSITLYSCDQKKIIKGEVFIATRGGENIELGLVPVQAIEASEMSRHLEKQLREAQDRVSQLSERSAGILDSISTLSNKKPNYTPLSDYVRRGNVGEESLSPGDRITARFQRARVYVNPSLRDVRLYSVERSNFGKVVKSKTNQYKVSFEGHIDGWVDAEDVMLASQYERWTQKRKTVERLNDKISNLIKKLNYLFSKIIEYRSESFYIKNIPQSYDRDKTNSDGEFELELEVGESYYIVAQASREVRRGEEKYTWIMKTKIDGNSLVLANDNMGVHPNEGYVLSKADKSVCRSVQKAAIAIARDGKSIPNWSRLVRESAFMDGSNLSLPPRIREQI